MNEVFGTKTSEEDEIKAYKYDCGCCEGEGNPSPVSMIAMYFSTSYFLESACLKIMGELFALDVIFQIVYAIRANFSSHDHVLNARNMEIASISADTSIPIIKGEKKTTPILKP